MNQIESMLEAADKIIWGPAMLVFLVGTGIFLTVKTRFVVIKNLPYAIKCVFRKENKAEEGDVTSFQALMTTMAATIGTGNIVGVSTAVILGGPGALFWMWVSAVFGMTTKFAECFLSVKYRKINENGQISGGPMFVMHHAIKPEPAGKILAVLFSIFTLGASFGIGNMTQANSAANALSETFSVSHIFTGIVISILTILIISKGIKSISAFSRIVVPAMALLYILAGLIVIFANGERLFEITADIFISAFSVKPFVCGVSGGVMATMANAVKYGISRGVFSNEAGIGSAAITASAAKTDSAVRQGYINMTAVFFDTIIVCTVTGYIVLSSTAYGTLAENGSLLTGAALTIKAFEGVLKGAGAVIVSTGITFFAFSTIIGWEYIGEKALEYLCGHTGYCFIYRIVYAFAAFVGAVNAMEVIWRFSDIMNGLMAVPNLLTLIILSGTVSHSLKKHAKDK